MEQTRTSSAFPRVLKRLVAVLKGRKGTEWTFQIQEDGIDLHWLTLEGEEGTRKIRWEDISTLTAYKRDLITTDMICLLCECSDRFQMEFHEEIKDWQTLLEALSKNLPGCPAYADWWHDVAVPAFATNERVLFKRD